jgi:hypothetical protein
MAVAAAVAGGLLWTARPDASSVPARAGLPIGSVAHAPSIAGRLSAALGARERAYAVTVRNGGLVAGGALQSRFGRSGLSVHVGAVRADLHLRAFGYGSRLLSLPSVEPSAHANVVRYAWSGIAEWFANGPFGLEQGFTVSAAPPAARGPLTIAIDVSGGARPLQSGPDVVLAGSARATLRYSGLRAVDASGRVLPSWLAVDGRAILIRVRTDGARFPVRIDPLVQQGEALTATGAEPGGELGTSVALSAGGTTALIGAPRENGGVGAAYVFTRSAGGVWTQQGLRLTGVGEAGAGRFGCSVALSADGNIAVVGGDFDAKRAGAVWVFTRSGGTWSQQGAKLTGINFPGTLFGHSVAMSADGTTMLAGAPGENGTAGAVWALERLGPSWQFSPLQAAEGETGDHLGEAVALSSDGANALLGAPGDLAGTGAAWAFTRTSGQFGTFWSQQGGKLTAPFETGAGQFGTSVALSSRGGGPALIGAPGDNGKRGSAWFFSYSVGGWTATEHVTPGEEVGAGEFGSAVSLAGEPLEALIGGRADNHGEGAAWLFVKLAFTEQTGRLVAARSARLGASVALSYNGDTAIAGAPATNSRRGAAFVFAAPPRPPLFEGLSPQRGSQSGANLVTITGFNLGDASAVMFGGAAAAFTVVSSTKITATAPPGSGTVDVRVLTPAGGTTIESGDRYTYQSPEEIEAEEAAREAAAGIPVVTSVTPSAVLTSGNATVTLTGANFVGVTEVLSGQEQAVSFTVNSSTSITAVVPVPPPPPPAASPKPFLKIRGSQPVFITVRASGGLSRGRGESTLTWVQAGPSPVINAVTPSKGPSGGGERVTISGSGLEGPMEVRFGTHLATQLEPVFEHESSILTAVVPAGAEGRVPVTIVTPNGTTPPSSAAGFTYGPPVKPTVNYVNPRSGPAQGGTVVTVGGTNFAAGMMFSVGSKRVAGAECISTSCTIVTPPGLPGNTVSVIAINGKSRSVESPEALYTYE